MKKNDKILILIVCAIAALFGGYHFLKKDAEAGIVKVQVAGSVYGTYSLQNDQVVDIDEHNRMKIENGTVTMTWATCPDQICVEHRAISREGESIICLPNKVVLSIIEGEDAELDAVAN